MTNPIHTQKINEYGRLFEICQSFIGQKVEQIIFYLDETDINYTEQPNEYGKSLFNAVEFKILDQTYCLGNLFFDKNFNGLNIKKGKTIDYELIDDKKPIIYPSELIGKEIIKTVIYWTESHYGRYFVPQEIEFKTETNLFLCSAIEINYGEVTSPLTDELLIVENKYCLEKFKLGEYGILTNERYVFSNVDELMENEKNIS
jgi:hypothetical protein